MSWRGKLILLLIVYFAGFATATYTLAPAPNEQEIQAEAVDVDKADSVLSRVKSDEFVNSFNEGIHKALAFGKETAIKAGEYLREKYKEIKETES